jgi:RNA recognition motif-containing protein
MAAVVHVSGISSQTSEKEVRDFFSFCGKISSLSVKEDTADTKSATVTFEKETAAKTALLLDNTQLGPAQVKVTSDSTSTSTSAHKDAETSGEDLHQEDKPRSRILAEYLAHGYVISDQVIEKGLALDKQHGISNRFTSTLLGFNDKYKVTDKAAVVDDKYALSNKAGAAWGGLASYFDKAQNTPTGQKLRAFYEQGSKQVLDVHNEARHLANLKASKSTTEPTVGESSTTSGEKSTVTAEEANMEKVGDSDRTKCNCGATAEKCPCAPGKCACSKCSKNADVAA